MTPEEVAICLHAAEAGYFDDVWVERGSKESLSFRDRLARRAGELLGRFDDEIRYWFNNALGPEVWAYGGSDLWTTMSRRAPWQA